MLFSLYKIFVGRSCSTPTNYSHEPPLIVIDWLHSAPQPNQESYIGSYICSCTLIFYWILKTRCYLLHRKQICVCDPHIRHCVPTLSDFSGLLDTFFTQSWILIAAWVVVPCGAMWSIYFDAVHSTTGIIRFTVAPINPTTWSENTIAPAKYSFCFQVGNSIHAWPIPLEKCCISSLKIFIMYFRKHRNISHTLFLIQSHFTCATQNSSFLHKSGDQPIFCKLCAILETFEVLVIL